MLKRIIVILFVFFCTFVTNAYPQEKIPIAVLDFKGTDVPEETTSAVTDQIKSDIANSNLFKILDKQQISEILKEHDFQQMGCSEESCAVEIGKMIAANKVIIGEVTKIGQSIIIIARLVDVEKREVEFSVKRATMSEDNIISAASVLTKNIIRKINGEIIIEDDSEIEMSSPKIPCGYYLRGFVPGWAQFYSGHYIQGTMFGLAFLGGLTWTIVALLNYNNSKNNYKNLELGLSQNEYDNAYNKYENEGKAAFYSLAGLTVIYSLNWIDVLHFTKPKADKKAGIFKYDDVYIALDVNLQRGYYKTPDVKTDLSFTISF